MNLVADESTDRRIVERLRQGGHRVWYVAEMAPGIPDDAVLDLANREGAVLLTADKDFGELVVRQRRVSSGVVLIRLAGLSSIRKAEIVTAVIDEHAIDLLFAFTVISAATVRIRR